MSRNFATPAELVRWHRELLRERPELAWIRVERVAGTRNRIAAFVRRMLGLYSPSVDLMPALAAYWWETDGRLLMAYFADVHQYVTLLLAEEREQ